MTKRIVTAVCALALFIPICIYSYTIVFPLAMAVLCVVATNEMLGCIGVKKNYIISSISYVIAAAMPLLPSFIDEHTMELEMALCVIYLIGVFTAVVLDKGTLDYTYAASVFMGVFYVCISFTSIVMLREESDFLYLTVFIGPWLSDTFAYFVGRRFGKHKLIPTISPNKTVEGSIGGIVGGSLSITLFGVVVYNLIDKSLTPHYYALAVSGIVISVISQIGDLAASAIKRRFGIKDFGFVFPGHGGVLDRFDSVLLTAPVVYIISQLPIVSGRLI